MAHTRHEFLLPPGQLDLARKHAVDQEEAPAQDGDDDGAQPDHERVCGPARQLARCELERKIGERRRQALANRCPAIGRPCRAVVREDTAASDLGDRSIRETDQQPAATAHTFGTECFPESGIDKARVVDQRSLHEPHTGIEDITMNDELSRSEAVEPERLDCLGKCVDWAGTRFFNEALGLL